MAEYCETYNNLIPVAFVLGFYVSVVVGRFWEQFKSIPWPSRMALYVSALVQGNDARGRLMRRTIMRYLSLTYVITMSSISPGVKKRFPTYLKMQEAGFMLPNELEILEGMKTTYNIYFVPLVWSASLITRARKEGRIKDDFAVKTLIDEINDYRGKCGGLFGFDWVTIPLVYTQVVTIAVYMFFLSCLMGRQYLSTSERGFVGDMYFPLFTFLQFFFYMGWLKVAETLLNPFGEDDDDFDINGIIDSSLQQSYLVVDEMHEKHPELIRDQYWDTYDIDIPYTESSLQYQKPDHIGSAADLEVCQSESVMQPVPSSSMTEIPEEDEPDEAPTTARYAVPSSARSMMKYPDFSKSFGSRQNFMNPKTKGPASRAGSRAGSVLSLFGRSMSQFSKRGRDNSVVNIDAEKQINQTSPISLQQVGRAPSRRESQESKPVTPQNSRREDMMFELSDDEQSPFGGEKVGLSVIDELTPKPTSFSKRLQGKTRLAPLRIQSMRMTEMPASTAYASPSQNTQSVRETEFNDEVLKRLQELRGGPETPETARNGPESAGFQPHNGAMSLK